MLWLLVPVYIGTYCVFSNSFSYDDLSWSTISICYYISIYMKCWIVRVCYSRGTPGIYIYLFVVFLVWDLLYVCIHLYFRKGAYTQRIKYVCSTTTFRAYIIHNTYIATFPCEYCSQRLHENKNQDIQLRRKCNTQ